MTFFMLYPIGIQDFESIRTNGFVYVDKTALVYKLATTGRYYFLSRPRRFGKSLPVSMMEAYFSGRKDLFEGLAVSGMEKDWTAYTGRPAVILIDEYDKPDVISLLYQTGYLTIAGYNPDTDCYTLSEYFTPVRDNWSELSAA